MGVGIGIAATVVYLTNRSIVPPILKMVSAMGRLAGGDHSVEVPATGNKDEIGLMARAVVIFKENMIKAKELAAKEAEAINARMARATRVTELTATFDTNMSTVLRSVAAASTELQATASSMTATAEETSSQATAVAAATEEASTQRADGCGGFGGTGEFGQRNQPPGGAIRHDRAQGRDGGRPHQRHDPGAPEGCRLDRRRGQA